MGDIDASFRRRLLLLFLTLRLGETERSVALPGVLLSPRLCSLALLLERRGDLLRVLDSGLWLLLLGFDEVREVVFDVLLLDSTEDRRFLLVGFSILPSS